MLAVPVSMAASGWLGGAWGAFAQFAPTAMLLLIAVRATDTLARVKGMMGWLLTLSIVLSVHGIDQARSGVGWTGATMIADRIRYIGILNDPNDLANILLFTLPFSFLFATAGSVNRLFRIVACIAGASALWAIALTNSRGAFLALIAMILAYFWLQRSFRIVMLLGPVMAVALMVLAPERLDESSGDGGESSASRIFAWYAGLQVFQEYPIFGAGFGRFLEFHERTAHNSFVLALAEVGAFGYLCWFGLVMTSLLLLWRVASVAAPPVGLPASEARVLEDVRRQGRTLLIAMVGLIVSAFFLSRTYMPTLFLALGMSLGFFETARRADPRIPPILRGRVAFLTATVGLASIVLLWVFVRIGTIRYVG
jgi:O-antigen ligase